MQSPAVRWRQSNARLVLPSAALLLYYSPSSTLLLLLRRRPPLTDSILSIQIHSQFLEE